MHSDNLSWVLKLLKDVVDRNPIIKNLGLISNDSNFSQSEVTVLLENAVNTEKRKRGTTCEIMCKDYVDVMEKIDGNYQQMIKVAKVKFDEMCEEIMKIRSSSSKNATSSQSSTQFHSFANVEEKSFI